MSGEGSGGGFMSSLFGTTASQPADGGATQKKTTPRTQKKAHHHSQAWELSHMFRSKDDHDLKPMDVGETQGKVTATQREDDSSRVMGELNPGTIIRVIRTSKNNRLQVKAETGDGEPPVEGWVYALAPDGQPMVKRISEHEAAMKLLKPYKNGGTCEVKARTACRSEKSQNSSVAGHFEPGQECHIMDKQGAEVLLQTDTLIGWVTGVTAGGLALAPVGTHAKHSFFPTGLFSGWGSSAKTGETHADLQQDVFMTDGATPKGLADSSQDPFLSQGGKSRRDADTPGNPFQVPGGGGPSASSEARNDPFLTTSERSRGAPRSNAGQDPFMTGEAGAAPSASADAGMDAFLTHGKDMPRARFEPEEVRNDPFMSHEQAPAAARSAVDSNAFLLAQQGARNFEPRVVDGDPFAVHEHQPIPAPTGPVAVDPFLNEQQRDLGIGEPEVIQEDPFMVHEHGTIGLKKDPFSTAAKRTDPKWVENDPYLTGQQPAEHDVEPLVMQADPFLTEAIPYDKDVLPVDVSNDPFMRHAAAVNIPRNLDADPFGTHGRVNPFGDQDQDPFLVRVVAPREIPPEGKVHKCCRHCNASVKRSARFCGLQIGNCCSWFWGFGWLSGPKRTCGFCGDEINQVEPDMIVNPWLLFMLVLICGLVLRHYSIAYYMLVIMLAGFGPLFLFGVGLVRGMEKIDPNVIKVALLMMVAVVAGVLVAQFGWNFYARQFWWMWTAPPSSGREFTLAMTPPVARADSSWMRYPDRLVANEMRQTDTQVDTSRAAGFRDGKTYCVAPILSSKALQSELIHVNYWAIGTDCCDPGGGGFTCDASREREGQFGVVMKSRLPCFWCELHRFDPAIRKAEALHSMASGADAVLVRYVKDPYAMRTGLGWSLVWLVVIAALTSFLFFVSFSAFLRGDRWQRIMYGMGAPKRAYTQAKRVFIDKAQLAQLDQFHKDL